MKRGSMLGSYLDFQLYWHIARRLIRGSHMQRLAHASLHVDHIMEFKQPVIN